VVAVRKDAVWVSVDTRLPNRAVGKWLAEGRLPEFRAYRNVQPEVALGESRIDFLLRNGRDCYLEVKSCTLVEGDSAFFPDAPTDRGRRHVATLAEAAERGLRSSVLFVVQRPDASLFRPRDETDPAFADALRDARGRGVEVYAYRSRFVEGQLVDPRRIQTDLGPREMGLR
jgi:sugar fermentation stimulation protein A